MTRSGSPIVLLLLLSAVAHADVDYDVDVRPLLDQYCSKCHGSEKQRGMFRLDTAPLAIRGGESGPAIVPGDPDASRLYRAVTAADGWRMPPEEAGEGLSEDEIAILRRWIESGALAPPEPEPVMPAPHWAFVSPVAHPAGTADAANDHPVDHLLSIHREQAGVAPVPEADRRTLIRRIHLDLVGVPPTPEQVDRFLADPSPDGWERLVDELLASPLYGERWGRHFMDIWRYSDWYGFNQQMRNSHKHMWRWRDWIVESLNDDIGYDRMIREMLAADEIAPTDPDRLRATGFLARNWFLFNRDTWLDDTVEHTGKAFLGLTFNCARCHEHKYDPISHRDYYRFRAFFEPHRIRIDRVPGEVDTEKNGISRAFDADLEVATYRYIRGNDKDPDKTQPLGPALPRFLSEDPIEIEPVDLPLEARYEGMQPWLRKKLRTDRVLAVRQAEGLFMAAGSGKVPKRLQRAWNLRIAPATEAEAAELAEKYLAAAEAKLAAFDARREADDARVGISDGDTKLLAARALRLERRAAFLDADYAHMKAAAELPTKTKPAQVTMAKGKLKRAETALAKARKALANAGGEYKPLSEIHPATSSGRRLALANWIASRDNPLTARVLVNHVWMRHFGTPLVETTFDFGTNGAGPSHPELLDTLAVEFMESGWSIKWLHRRIVTSAAYRMASSVPTNLAVNLDRDPDNRLLWRQNAPRLEAEIVRDAALAVAGDLDLRPGGPELDPGSLQSTFRRSLYYRHAPEKQSRFLEVFDAPDPTDCYRRERSVVPQQALALTNSPMVISLSRRLAARIDAVDDAGYVDRAFERVLGRPASHAERAACLAFLDEQTRTLADGGTPVPFPGATAKAAVPASEDPSQRAREGLVLVLLNHHDFIARK